MRPSKKDYRGNNDNGDATVHVLGSSSRQLTRDQKNRRKRRSAVEPEIGHLKSDNRVGRCLLKGVVGEEINAVLAATGSNVRKLLATEHALIFWLATQLEQPISAQNSPQPLNIPATRGHLQPSKFRVSRQL